MIQPTRPIIRYHGGKWRLADWIIPHLPPHKVYVEPFGGAASVLLKKQRSYAEVYNDLDGEVVNLFQIARERGEELARALELTPFARDEFNLSYEPTTDPLECARRLVIRAAMGRGTSVTKKKADGDRKKMEFRCYTGPAQHPADGWRNYPPALRTIIDRLQGVVIENRDAGDVMRQHDSPDTLHYVDPPYVADTRDAGGDYAFEMTNADHEQLAELLHSLQGMVVLSGYRSELYDHLFRDWQRIERGTYADGAKPRTEALWLSPNCPPAGLFEMTGAV